MTEWQAFDAFLAKLPAPLETPPRDNRFTFFLPADMYRSLTKQARLLNCSRGAILRDLLKDLPK